MNEKDKALSGGGCVKKGTGRKVGIVVLCVAFWPLILIFFLVAGICALVGWLREPSRRKRYEQSLYCQELGVPYRRGILGEDGFRFYQQAREEGLDFEFVPQEGCNWDYVVYRGQVFLFGLATDVLYGIYYDDSRAQWMANVDGEEFPLAEQWEKNKKELGVAEDARPVLMAVEREMVLPRQNEAETETSDCAMDLLPPFVRVGETYLDAIKNG